ncbi:MULTISPECIES: hypothetical protein [unclassified Mesorhizobium]|uniref:hypothetical protein n=1 Tax=unclassified Mesorhizobium TaxID=325217 RepID=UPI000BB061A9|nr:MULTISPECIES: hypothetical protein [unclassified Mesorhizobium]PBB35190.1 hypothetical protein CK214_05980 [Mesorhizobium sp. WSM3882]RUV03040.1 hypothetical protein EOA79_16625 [Mesorhizobium sp. M1A.F.Ca.IN.020.03.2.1]RUV88581.1 hypothetical protein EOA51_06780 [Mesorhizobium sp. M1A.F.Ca.IN.020.32.1.1]RUW12450.1 hypothetical protein EOA46_09310 [Mesorhizobium sp. M1A.F.Ca.IN.022.05.2.1]RWF78742.1 MAG: hypothetical protein EOQ35_22185 [Mesorhizobium sp.]
MSELTSVLFAGAIVFAVVLHLAWLARSSRNRARAALADDEAAIRAVIRDAIDVSDGTAGVATWAGSHKGERAQVRTIVDTLATRKLPARWLSVSITEPVAVPGVFDMMMRPGSPTSFSNFDHLEHSLPKTAAFPDEAVLRTDRKGIVFPQEVIAAHAGISGESRAKELLITPKGVRIVWLLAQADRARYGVFRQAAFGDARLDPTLIEKLLEAASSIRDAINQCERQAA